MVVDEIRVHDAFDSFRDAHSGIGGWIEYYNDERPHSRLTDQTPGLPATGSIIMNPDYTLKSLPSCPNMGSTSPLLILKFQDSTKG